MAEGDDPGDAPPILIRPLQVLLEPLQLGEYHPRPVLLRVVELVGEEDEVGAAKVVAPPEVVHGSGQVLAGVAALAEHAEARVVGGVVLQVLVVARHHLVGPVAGQPLDVAEEGVTDLAVGVAVDSVDQINGVMTGQ